MVLDLDSWLEGKTVSEIGYNKTIKKVSDKKRSFSGFLAVVGRGVFEVYGRRAADVWPIYSRSCIFLGKSGFFAVKKRSPGRE